MLSSRRDYLLRIIDEVGVLLRRVLQQRTAGRPDEGLLSVVAACERLFQLEATQLFQFTPYQHVAMLAEGEPPEGARDKILLYAALNQEAGRCYRALGNAKLSQQSFLNALRLTLKARQTYPLPGEPDYTPHPAELLTALGNTTFDADTSALLAAAGLSSQPPKSSP
ncbi:MAG: hypothetical protein ABI222_04565 [Opitutaceae bacterium]